jgi:phosphatidate phosphatase APP1
MKKRAPVLLSFYGLSNGVTNVLFGQLTYGYKSDLSFQKYTWIKTFRTLLALYRTKAIANKEIELTFNNRQVKTTTDASGSFYIKVSFDVEQTLLTNIKMCSGEVITILNNLYTPQIDYVENYTIVISDIDDTILQSHISNKLLKFFTVMFTSVEKRKAIVNMMQLIKDFAQSGAASFYLSNSEQNLYPLIYRFFANNQFPEGPIFLKQMRGWRDVFINKKYPEKDAHKQRQLKQIIELFPDKHYILIGDNTQNDLKIYLQVAREFPTLIRHIIIRKVIDKKRDKALIKEHIPFLESHAIGMHYSDTFPTKFEL